MNKIRNNYITLRKMSLQDLAHVCDLQTQSYGAQFHESRQSFEARLNFFPEGAWVATETHQGAGNQIVGYMFSYPWNLQFPPRLGSTEMDLTDGADCYYIHDVSIHPGHRGKGIANALIEKAEEQALATNLTCLALISVQKSRSFWERFNFECAAVQMINNKALQSYGIDAVYMVKCLDTGINSGEHDACALKRQLIS